MPLVVDRESLAWAAGFFDGEGSFVGGRRALRSSASLVEIAQTDRRVLDRFQQAVGGLGYVYGPRQASGRGHSPVFAFRSTAFEHTQAIAALLWPWLGEVKRDQARRVLIAARESQRAIAEARQTHRCGHARIPGTNRCRLCKNARDRARRRPIA